MNHLFKKASVALLTIPILIVCTQMTKAQTLNFSGDWKINPPKSDFGKFGERSTPIEIKINQTKDSIIIERISRSSKGEIHSYVERLAINGNPVKILIGNSRSKTTAVKWVEDKQAMTEIANYQDDMAPEQYATSKGTETWSMSGDGKTLTIKRLDEFRDGNVPSTGLYDKQ